MKIIKDQDTVIAIYIPKDTPVDGLKFITPQDYPFQVGILHHPEEKIIPLHRHRKLQYNFTECQEFLYVMEGNNIEIELFNDEWKELDTILLSAGDAILLASGGHSLKIPKGGRIMEVKQGPYPGDKEAKIFRD